jgi:polyhydroxyalkanoate synthesis repressor PhaR
MIVIKRYPNRKLYDTGEKKYITLEGIADLIRDGNEVQVFDHTTGEDLTALTLTQIIFEQEKKQSGFLPRAVLAGLVKAGGETLVTLRRTLALPLDLLHQVDEEIERRVHHLVRQGDLAEEDGRRLLEKLLSAGGRAASKTAGMTAGAVEEEIGKLLVEWGVPTRQDLQQLGEQLDDLFVALEEVNLPSSPDQPDSD